MMGVAGYFVRSGKPEILVEEDFLLKGTPV